MLELNTHNDIYESKNLLKDISRGKDLEKEIDNNKIEFGDIVKKAVDIGAKYIIRAMPVNNNIKEILYDVEESFKTHDFKEVVKTAINSTIREGLEMLSVPKDILKDLNKMKEVAVEGGLAKAISAGAEIILNRSLKKNIYGDEIKDFIIKLKAFINNKGFIDKLDQGINKSLKRVDKFKDLCAKWFEAYDTFNVDDMNIIAGRLKQNVKKIEFNKESINSNNLIQNVTKLINNKKEKLSPIEMKACSLI